jgi:hypothetical protein
MRVAHCRLSTAELSMCSRHPDFASFGVAGGCRYSSIKSREVFSFVNPETLFFVRRWLRRRIGE